MNDKSSANVQFFQNMLRSMMKMEYPVVKGLVGAEGIFKGHFFKKVVRDIQQKLQGGLTISQSLEEYPEYFSPLFLKMVDVGEKTGTLPSIIEHYFHISESTSDINRKVKNLFIQPAVTLFVAVFVISLSFVTAYPAFQMLYAGFGRSIPLISKVVMGTAEILKNNFEPLLVITGVLVLITALLRRKKGFRNLSDRVLYKLPFIGKGYQLAAQTRWTEVLKILLENNVRLPEAVLLAGQASGYVIYERQSILLASKIEEGEPLGAHMKKKILPVSMAQILVAGEEKGGMVRGLESISNFLNTELETQIPEIEAKTRLVITIILGIIVGTLVFSLYMPLFMVPRILL